LLLALVAAPIGACALVLRPAWQEGLYERLGLLAEAPPRRAPIWLHAASSGEVRAMLSLVVALRARGHDLFLSATTLAGREFLRGRFPDLPSAFAPLDHPWCIDAALGTVDPRLLVLIETELWPSWIAGSVRRGVPVVVVSGRLSDRSFARYRRLRGLFSPTLRKLAAVGARGECDAERFIALGADRDRVFVTGDLKLDSDPVAAPLAPDLERALGNLSVFVAGSTHDVEELAALRALEACEAAGHVVTLVVAPRRPGKAPAVARLFRREGRTVRLRSELSDVPLAEGEILVLDSMGELSAVYGVASVAFVGGTLVSVGGHNLLEPVHAGCPVIFGPNVASVREAAQMLCCSGAGVQVTDGAGIGAAAVALLEDPAGARARVEAGKREFEARRGNVERSVALIERVLAENTAARPL
jgi:3-deoxy-D-manno-octulosonic-acid transferase